MCTLSSPFMWFRIMRFSIYAEFRSGKKDFQFMRFCHLILHLCGFRHKLSVFLGHFLVCSVVTYLEIQLNAYAYLERLLTTAYHYSLQPNDEYEFTCVLCII